jgi:hypothetical protein
MLSMYKEQYLSVGDLMKLSVQVVGVISQAFFAASLCMYTVHIYYSYIYGWTFFSLGVLLSTLHIIVMTCFFKKRRIASATAPVKANREAKV